MSLCFTRLCWFLLSIGLSKISANQPAVVMDSVTAGLPLSCPVVPAVRQRVLGCGRPVPSRPPSFRNSPPISPLQPAMAGYGAWPMEHCMWTGLVVRMLQSLHCTGHWMSSFVIRLPAFGWTLNGKLALPTGNALLPNPDILVVTNVSLTDIGRLHNASGRTTSQAHYTIINVIAVGILETALIYDASRMCFVVRQSTAVQWYYCVHWQMPITFETKRVSFGTEDCCCIAEIRSWRQVLDRLYNWKKETSRKQ